MLGAPWPATELKEGFTLLELLVVVAISVVLVALLLPALSRTKAKAQRPACVNNLRQINLGVRMYADDSEDISPGSRTNSSDPFTAYKQLMKNYVGLNGASSASDRLFACPADRFYYDYDERISQSLHQQSRNDYSSYAFNAGNALPGAPPGTPPPHPWPGIAGRQLSSIRDPARTVLVAEFPALLPYSWHEPGGKSHYNNARDVVSFVDGHVSYIRMYWDPNNATAGHQEAWHYDPPAGYDYKWSAE